MRAAALVIVILAGALGLAACGDNTSSGRPDAGPPWLVSPEILVPGVGSTALDCTTQICPHNENVDMLSWNGAIYLVHRTAQSQVLGPNSSLRFYKSTDGGAHFQLLEIIPAPTEKTYPAPDLSDRDLRDPSIYVVNGNLTMKAITRLPIGSTRDSNVQSITVDMTSTDGGLHWSRFRPITPPTWSFWRVIQSNGHYYSAAYEDGDMSVKLFSSADGVTWTPGAVIYGVSADTPLETELVVMPSGRMLALVRVDGTDAELLGNVGRLREKVCWAMPPYDTWSCPQELSGVRLDGPVAFWHSGRLFVSARKHFIETADRKRTALYEIGGTLEGGPLTITELGIFPSGGDTAYAGVAPIDADHFVHCWYSSDVDADAPWGRAIFEAADIWQATIDMTKL